MNRWLGFLLLAGVLLVVGVGVRDELASGSGRTVLEHRASAGVSSVGAPRRVRVTAVSAARTFRPASFQGSGATALDSLRTLPVWGQGVGAVQTNARLASRPETLSGGPLSPCPGHSAYSSEYRWTNGHGVHRGCTTAYATWEYLSGGGTTACGEQLFDNQYTAAVSRNLPEFNRGAYVRCGTKALVCGVRCVVVRINDRGPCNNPPSCTEDYSRDFDLSYAAAIRIGKSKAAWGDPVVTWWRACGLHTPAGSSRCSP